MVAGAHRRGRYYMYSNPMIGAVVPRRSFGLWLGLLGCLVATPHPTRAQATAGISGQLVDRTSRQPVEGAAITVLGTPLLLRSSNTGQFTHTGLKPGVYVMQARAFIT